MVFNLSPPFKRKEDDRGGENSETYKNTSIAARGALAHRLQCLQNQKWPKIADFFGGWMYANYYIQLPGKILASCMI